MTDTRSYSFEFKDYPDDMSPDYMSSLGGAITSIISSMVKTKPDIIITEEIYKQAYESGLFIQRLNEIDLSGVFEYEKVTDPTTQYIFTEQVRRQLSRHLSDYLVDPALRTGYFEVNHDKRMISVKFLDDYERVSKFYVDVLNAGCAIQWAEFNQTREMHITRDVEAMKKIYSESKTWKNLEEVHAGITKIQEDDKPTLAKYYVIIINMSKFGFSEKVFKDCVGYWYLNRSKTPKEIMDRYFKLSMKKDHNYNRNVKELTGQTAAYEAECRRQSEAKQSDSQNDDNDDTDSDSDDDGDDGGGGDVQPTPDPQIRSRRKFFENICT